MTDYWLFFVDNNIEAVLTFSYNKIKVPEN